MSGNLSSSAMIIANFIAEMDKDEAAHALAMVLAAFCVKIASDHGVDAFKALDELFAGARQEMLIQLNFDVR